MLTFNIGIALPQRIASAASNSSPVPQRVAGATEAERRAKLVYARPKCSGVDGVSAASNSSPLLQRIAGATEAERIVKQFELSRSVVV